MKSKQQVQVRAGDVVPVTQITVVTTQAGVGAQLKAPRGRHLVVAVLGVTDPDVPFDVDTMFAAMGYVKETANG